MTDTGQTRKAIDPASTAYRVHAHAFNTLTEKTAGAEWYMPLSERDAIATAIVEAVEPIIRADERGQAAPGLTELRVHGEQAGPQGIYQVGHNYTLPALLLVELTPEQLDEYKSGAQVKFTAHLEKP